MSDLDDLVHTANKLCESLDIASNNEKKFCHNVQHELERMSWEMLRISNDLRQIKEYTGV